MRSAREAMGPEDFVQLVTLSVPEAGAVVLEHIGDNDGLLLHLLMSDLLRLTVRLFHAGELVVEQRLLDVIATALLHGDENVVNAVAVSFVEDVGALPGETAEYVASWPRPLLEERARQLATSSRGGLSRSPAVRMTSATWRRWGNRRR